MIITKELLKLAAEAKEAVSAAPIPQIERFRPIRNSIATMEPSHEGEYVRYTDHAAALAASEARVASLRKDAERYRWLRKDIGVSARNSDCPRDVLLLAEWVESAEQLDAAIDALLPKGEGATS